MAKNGSRTAARLRLTATVDGESGGALAAGSSGCWARPRYLEIDSPGRIIGLYPGGGPKSRCTGSGAGAACCSGAGSVTRRRLSTRCSAPRHVRDVHHDGDVVHASGARPQPESSSSLEALDSPAASAAAFPFGAAKSSPATSASSSSPPRPAQVRVRRSAVPEA